MPTAIAARSRSRVVQNVCSVGHQDVEAGHERPRRSCSARQDDLRNVEDDAGASQTSSRTAMASHGMAMRSASRLRSAVTAHAPRGCARAAHGRWRRNAARKSCRACAAAASRSCAEHDAPRPAAHDVDGVGEEHRLAQIVRHQHAGEALLLPERAHDAPQLLAREGVERAERLVEHQQRGLMDQRAADRWRAAACRRRAPTEICRAKPARPTVSSSFIARALVLGAMRGGSGACTARRSPAAAGRCPAWCATAAGSGSGTPCRRP